ncbi:MAG: transposase [Calditrichaeota bacterium]|nr:MAG: transposase [Calditrichota bacterium]
MTVYKTKYRVESARLENWDYASDGHYFITICTKNRACLFGDVIDGHVRLSDAGKIVLAEWEKSFQIRSELSCDCFIIMPNHIHAVVMIKNDDTGGGVETHGADTRGVETHGRASLQNNGRASLPSPKPQPTKSVATRRPKSISSFVAGFKSAATKRINEYRKTPAKPVWQSRFHGHIVRDEKSLIRIRHYIINNPGKWTEDDLYSKEAKL